MRHALCTLAILALLSASACGQDGTTETEAPDDVETIAMSAERLDELYRSLGDNVVSSNNVWSFSFAGVGITSVISVRYDRMRIMAPIIAIDEVSPQQKDRMLVANYESALDARYGVNDGILYAAFIHPLSTLDDQSVASALRQVATLAATFGSQYTSGELDFIGPGGRDSTGDDDDKRDEIGT
ncbi:MAG: hypothetical protein AAGD86_03275 [Pseudomonadota bacterium]